MKIFKDTAGRDWVLCINVDSIRRVKALTGCNLIDALDGKLIQQLSEDPMLLCDVIYALVKADCDQLKVTGEDFGKSIGGDALDRAISALLEELVDFFPLRRRQVLTKALLKFRDVEQKAMTLASNRLDAVNVDLLLKNASDTSGVSPASSGSTLVR